MKKRVLQAASEREFAKFRQAVQELNDQIDEARFQQILNRLLGINHRPRRRIENNPSGPVTVIPLRCVDCCLKAELVPGRFRVQRTPASRSSELPTSIRPILPQSEGRICASTRIITPLCRVRMVRLTEDKNGRQSPRDECVGRA
jgi:hypothetical protein